MAPLGDDKAAELERKIRRFLLGSVVIVALVLLVLWRVDNPRIERMRMALADNVLPSMQWVTKPLEFGAAITRDYRNFLDVYEQNRVLRREIQRLKAWRETARAREEQNAQLRALNNVRLAPRTSFVTGDVVADSGGPFSQSVLVNVGALDGVIDGSAAVDGTGLVGRVVGVGDHATRLLLLTDFSSRVPVLVQPSGRRAILVGDGSQAPRLDFIDGTEDVSPGHTLETSGDGGVFPPNLPVGRVIRAGNILRAALSSDYARLEFVRVLRYLPDTRIDRPGGLIARPGQPSVGPGSLPETEEGANASPGG